MTEIVIPKEITVYKRDLMDIKSQAANLTISSQKDMEKATDILHLIKKAKNTITERKEEITRPLMKSLASARDLFKPLELGYTDAEKHIKAQMSAYLIEEEARVEKEKERIAGRVERGTMKPETALRKMEGVGDASSGATGALGKVSTRTIRKVRIVDETAIPREYMVPDLAKITAAVIQEGQVIAGVEVYEEKQIVAK